MHMSAEAMLLQRGRVNSSVDSVSQKFKKTDVGVIPEDWSLRSLADLGRCLIGLTYDPKDIDPGGVLVLRASNIGECSLQFGDDVYVKMKIPDRLMAREYDLLICVRNGSRPLIGKCALIGGKEVGMTFGAFMSVFRSDDSCFVYHCFQTDIIKRQIRRHLGATINQITNKSLNSFTIPYPSRQERRVVTQTLSEVESLISVLDELIAKKHAIKFAVMQQLLTGKTRLPGFQNKWEKKRLGDICKFLRSANNPRSALNDSGGIRYIHYGDIHSWTNPVLNCASSYLPRIERSLVKSIPCLEDGDLIMVDASEDLAGVGKAVELDGVGEDQIVAGLHTIVCRENRGTGRRGSKHTFSSILNLGQRSLAWPRGSPYMLFPRCRSLNLNSRCL